MVILAILIGGLLLVAAVAYALLTLAQSDLSSISKIGTLVLVLLACKLSYDLACPKYSWRQRLTLEFSVDGEQRFASSVIEGSVRRLPLRGWGGEGGGEGFVDYDEGEVPHIDLGKYGVLLLTAQCVKPPPEICVGLWQIPLHAFGEETTNTTRLPRDLRDIGQLKYEQARKMSGKRQIPLDWLTTFAHFADRSYLLEYTAMNSKDIFDHFGGHIRLVHATSEITSDPVTFDLDEFFPNLMTKLRAESKSGKNYPPKNGEFRSMHLNLGSLTRDW
jgi:hypothetical protein